MTTTTNLVFIDTETTGLSPRLHDVIEVAWAVNDGPVERLVFPHTLNHADPAALAINQYYDRELDEFCTDLGRDPGPKGRLWQFHQDLAGATLVAMNYGFDRAMLAAKLGFEPWHYRSIEVSSVAMVVFDEPRPMSMADLRERVAALGYTVPEPDHTAVGDVECLRAAYKALRALRAPDRYRRVCDPSPFLLSPRTDRDV